MSQHQYPGINVDLKHPKYQSSRTTDSLYYSSDYDYDEILLPLREVFMMTLMDRLTDKPGWHKKVFDQDIVAKWRQEASEQSEKELFNEIVSKSRVAFSRNAEEENEAQENEDEDEDEWAYRDYPKVPFPRSRYISKDAFEYCLKELKAKAAHFEATGYVPTLDAFGRAIAKSDNIVDDTLKSELQAIFHQICTDQAAASSVDWHPGTNEMVQDLVHPSLYPFVYGRSPFIQDEVVDVENAIELWAGKGATAPDNPTLASNSDGYWCTTLGDGNNWSAKYQWLPSNLTFQDDGSVRFTSYINNLHPVKYTHVYRTLEKLIDLAIPAWDQVLLADGMKESRFSVPGWVHDEETNGLWEPFDAEMVAQSNLKPNLRDLENIASYYGWVDRSSGYPSDITPELIEQHQDDIARWKWEHIRDAILPEPNDYKAVNYNWDTSIRETYKDSGLQVIIKMARIELTPEKPEYFGGGWHVEGMVNERICATALYYLDSENITPSYLAFRTQTDSDQEALEYGQNSYNWLERLYGVDFSEGMCLQYYGRVETREGRMLAFPNSFQHRVTPFSLKDRTKPGHRSFIALWLVDPSQRIVSTANVPPQQLDWWSEAVLEESYNSAYTHREPREAVRRLLQKQGMGIKPAKNASSPAAKVSPLPQELIEMVVKDHESALGNLMSHDEALNHRLQLMSERTALETHTNQSVGVETYSFCEH